LFFVLFWQINGLSNSVVQQQAFVVETKLKTKTSEEPLREPKMVTFQVTSITNSGRGF
jgi:hypothetical protein